MSQIKCFTKPGDILAKVVREGRRVNFASNDFELSDSIFNFCITSHSMRDWCIKELGWDSDRLKKQSFHDACNKFEYLKYARDIANGLKHFGLDKGKISTVRGVENDVGEFSYVDAQGSILGKIEDQPVANIVLPNGTNISTLTLVITIINNLKELMNNYQLAYDEVQCMEVNIVLSFYPNKAI
jgi:hypothetical protein